MTPTTFDRLRMILARDYRGVPAEMTPETALEAMGIDSLGAVELLWTVEDEFKIKLPPEPPLTLRTVGDVARYLDGIAAQGAAPAAGPAVPSPSDEPGA